MNIDVIIISDAKTPELEKVTRKCLETLFRTDSDHNFKAYIVESNHNVEYDDYAINSVTTVHPKEQFGYNKYLNIGRRLGSSDYVVLCNNDLTFGPNWASNILKVMSADPTIMSASPWCPETQGSNVEHINNIYEGYRVRGELAGWCIFQQRRIYDIIGDLNESVDFWYSDNIYAEQLQMSKIRHALIPMSIVRHHSDNVGETGKTLDIHTKMKFTMGQASKYEAELDKLKSPTK